MTWVEIISAVLGLSCVFLAGRGSKYNFWVGYVYNIFLFVLFWRQHLYSAMLLQPVAFAINFYGHWRWTHPREEEKNSKGDLKIGSLSTSMWVSMFTFVVLAGLLWARALQWLPERWPDVFAPDPQVLGMLDSVAGGKYCKHSALHQLGPLRHAPCQPALPWQRHLVAGELEKEIQQR